MCHIFLQSPQRLLQARHLREGPGQQGQALPSPVRKTNRWLEKAMGNDQRWQPGRWCNNHLEK